MAPLIEAILSGLDISHEMKEGLFEGDAGVRYWQSHMGDGDGFGGSWSGFLHLLPTNGRGDGPGHRGSPTVDCLFKHEVYTCW